MPLRQRLRFWSVTQWLIALNVAVYAADVLSRHAPARWGAFSAADALYEFQVWRFITFQFLHASPVHLFFNMVALYFFGTSVEARLGKTPFVVFYLACGTGGALAYILMWKLDWLDAGAYTQLVGASAGVFGALVGAAVLSPHSTVRLLFPPVTLRMRTLALIFVGLAVLTIWDRGANAGGEAAHLGGAVVGYVLIRNQRALNWITRLRVGSGRPGGRRRRFWRPGDPAENFFRRDVR